MDGIDSLEMCCSFWQRNKPCFPCIAIDPSGEIATTSPSQLVDTGSKPSGQRGGQADAWLERVLHTEGGTASPSRRPLGDVGVTRDDVFDGRRRRW